MQYFESGEMAGLEITKRRLIDGCICDGRIEIKQAVKCMRRDDDESSKKNTLFSSNCNKHTFYLQYTSRV